MITPARLWVIGAAVLALLVVVGGYFVAISPQLSAASTADQQRQAVEGQNAALEANLLTLEAKKADIGTAQSALQALRASIPASADTSAMLNELNALAAQNQVTITTVSFGTAAAYAPTAPDVVPVPAASTEGTSSTPTPTPTPAPTPAPAAPSGASAVPVPAGTASMATVSAPTSSLVTAENFVTIPLDLAVNGEYSKVLDFIAGVQSGARLFLVNHVTTTAATEAAPVGGEGDAAPATVGQPATGVISGLIYVLLGLDVTATDAAAAG